VAEKRGTLSSENLLIPSRQQQLSQRFTKMPNNVFHANTIKKSQKMPNYDVHAKHHFFMPNHFEKGHISGTWP